MVTDLSHLPDDVEALKQALRLSLTQAETAEQRRIDAEQKLLDSAAELAVARAKASEDLALIAAQKLRIDKLERQIYGARKERAASLIDQLELELEESDANATEDEIAANWLWRCRHGSRASSANAPNTGQPFLTIFPGSGESSTHRQPVSAVAE